METKSKKLDGNDLEITVSLTADEVQIEIDQAYKKAGKRRKCSNFAESRRAVKRRDASVPSARTDTVTSLKNKLVKFRIFSRYFDIFHIIDNVYLHLPQKYMSRTYLTTKWIPQIQMAL